MNPQIFREYDIRGIAGKDLTEDDAKSIGKAYGTLVQKHGNKKVSVGRDCRVTSELFSQRFIEGVLSTGCDAIDIGLCPTPVLYFSIEHLS
ncbi:MAG: phosphomannomutase, partial [Desulfobacteraceae bacterium]|nr:phosphomannomutase [Desulfobacteraceae bacterium]